MEKQTVDKINHTLTNKIINRKAMFIPLFCISAFGLVGYATADREAPKILSDKIQVAYGTDLKASHVKVTDNRDDKKALNIQFDTTTYDKSQLGTYNVEVKATDQFNNTATKTVAVEVVDNEAPVISAKDSETDVVVVEANASNDLTRYLSVKDNVDGDVTPFITTDKALDTTKLGVQTIKVTATDSSENTTEKSIQFEVKDTEKPTVAYKNGNSIDIDYGSSFNPLDYLNIADNIDKNPKTTSTGSVDTKKLGTYEVTTKAEDASGNVSDEVKLTVNVKDLSAPQINVSNENVQLTQGTSFNASSYLTSATDNKDGDVKKNVKTESNVDINKAGTYTIKYVVSDAAGNKAEKNVNVTVKSKEEITSGGIISTAKSKLGCAYVFGAAGSNVFDCSGFTQYVYAKNGKSLPRTAAAQYSATTRVSNLQAGDLVFFGNTYKSGISHVGIYIGGGQFIHAANERTGVTVSSLSNAYYASHYAGAGRR